jgi:hypothetical protein
MRHAVVLASVLLATSCYSPSVEPCRYVCNGAACPSGLTCNSQGMCATSATEMCGGDASVTDTPADSSCGWSVVSNVDPCALRADQETASWDLRDGENWVVNTDTLTVSVNNQTVTSVPIHLEDQATAVPKVPQVALIMVGDFSMAGQSKLQIVGARPLTLLVNGTAMVAGPIEIVPSFASAVGCPTAGDSGASVTSAAGAGGGGGGGFGPNANNTSGQAGGAGGSSPPPLSPGGPGGSGGQISGGVGDPRKLSPVRPGCPGGSGGTRAGAGSLGGRGGAGGGAIQISARTRIVLAGMISAPGAGGGIGGNGAGGGGGAGGAILLEAETVDLGAGARLCANGGSGATGSGVTTGVGQPGTCALTGALGGGEGANGTPASSSGGGGAAANVDAEAGQVGKPGTDTAANPSTSGGGGGGGVGRIRIHGQLTTAQPVLSSPMYTVP